MKLFPPRYLFLLFFTFGLSGVYLAASDQQKKIDSLNTVLKNAKQDTLIAGAYVALTEIYCVSNPDTVISICKKAISIVEKAMPAAGKKEKHALLLIKADALNNIGYIHQLHGHLDQALDYFMEGLVINKELGALRTLANSLNNLGVIYLSLGQAEKALEYLHQGLKIEEQLKDKKEMATTLGNIGAIHWGQGEPKKALEYCFESLKLREETGDQFGIAYSLNNIAVFYYPLGEVDKALDYNMRSLKIREKIGDKDGTANSLNNIGAIYSHKGDDPKALPFLWRSLKIAEESNFKHVVSTSLNNIGLTYLRLLYKNKDKRKLYADSAQYYASRALKAANSGGYVESIRNAQQTLSKVDSVMGKPAEAYEHFKQYIIFRDSLVNQSTRKAALKKQMQYEFGKKEALAKIETDKREAIQQEELKRQKLINWSATGSFGLVLLSGLLLFNRSRLKQKHKYQQQLTQHQKEQALAVMETQEQERKRIAEDLHDSLGHLLSTAKLNLQTMPGERHQLVEQSLGLMNEASVEIRNITFNLMPKTLEEEGLIPSLHELGDKVNAAGGAKVMVQIHGLDGFMFEKQMQFTIYRIIQEAVNNVLKYAGASEIIIQLIREANQLTVMIEDDGCGFNPEQIRKNARGLKNISSRAAWLGGETLIDSTPGRGTTLTILIPV